MGGSPSPHDANRSTVRLDRQDPHLRILCFNIFVRDQERSLRFYLDQLGFGLAYQARLQSGDRWVAVAPPDGSAILALVAPKPDSEEYKLIGRSTQVVFLTEDVFAKFEEWRKRGVRFHHPPQTHSWDVRAAIAKAAGVRFQPPPARHTWGGMLTRFEDVDGNSFLLVGFDEVSREIEAQ